MISNSDNGIYTLRMPGYSRHLVYRLLVWLIWLVPYIGGMLMGMML